MRIAVAALLAAMTMVGCNRPDVFLGAEKEPTSSGSSSNPSASWQPAFELRDASLKVNGHLTSGPINLADETFTYLFVYLDSDGLFMISTEPFGPTQEGGVFVGRRLTIEHEGVVMEFESQSDILDDPQARTAWVEFTPDFEMFAPGTQPADIVIGLADSRKQIPGFDRVR
ncbi:MAG: hypothetical protein R3282_08920 [Rhodothermales bacterium]|nr:hypothetical protein [Rhodothermales bacterium]